MANPSTPTCSKSMVMWFQVQIQTHMCNIQQVTTCQRAKCFGFSLWNKEPSKNDPSVISDRVWGILVQKHVVGWDLVKLVNRQLVCDNMLAAQRYVNSTIFPPITVHICIFLTARPTVCCYSFAIYTAFTSTVSSKRGKQVTWAFCWYANTCEYLHFSYMINITM